MQMIRQAGKDGKELHTIIIDIQPRQIFTNWDLTTSNSVKDVLGNDNHCRVLSTTTTLDGIAASKKGARPIRPLVPLQAQVSRAVKVQKKLMTLVGIPLYACGKLPGLQREGFAASAVSWQLVEMEGYHGSSLEYARAPNRGLVWSMTLADLPYTTEERWKVPDFSRNAEVQCIKWQRLEHTKKLNNPLLNLESIGQRYYSFRKWFNFKVYTYCFTCRLPQDQNCNASHGDAQSVGNTRTYLAWAALQEEVEGWYHNAIEVFLWCCERLEANNLRLFL
ncbi:hypothetical protein HD554DRAFT_2034359 [Boletus coccyginus]|nr:hypothetical protein HD554DRAFT_2034359 [Boletus coccyginus]